MSRSFSFGSKGIESVNGHGVDRAGGQVAVINGMNVDLYENPNHVHETKSSPAPGNVTGLDM